MCLQIRGSWASVRLVLALATTMVVVISVTLFTIFWPAGANNCPVSSAASPACGLWWGSALPVSNAALPAAVRARDATTGRRLDIVHTYHRWYDEFPTAAERAVAGAGHLLFLNWEPVNTRGTALRWASIAAGKHDGEIDAAAQRLKSIDGTVLISFSHVPEKDYRAHGSAADFAAAFRHVHDRMQSDGARNVRWVWNVMGLSDPVWLARYRTMWPGDAYVDWIAWDPYNWGSCRNRPWQSFSQTVRPFHDWLQSHGFGSKPFMLAEYGSVEQAGNAAGKADWLSGIPTAVKAMPNLRALVYFDLPTPPANCNWNITTSPQATKAFRRLAASSVFAKTASLDPTAAPS